MQVVHGALFESEVLVESFGFRIDGVHKDCPCANGLRCVPASL